MDVKPEIQKTVRRLAVQKNNEVLKNKLRSWIVTREMTVTELIRYCRDKSLTVPASVLNKLGLLFGSGKEGLNEDADTAFLLYLAAADFNFGPANGNVSQYYFDGRAPGGKNLDLAYQYCRKAIDLGADKFMLMSEILNEQKDFPETIKYLRKIIDSKQNSGDSSRRKLDARKLELECLEKLLINLFSRLSSQINANEATFFSSPPSLSMRSLQINTGSNTASSPMVKSAYLPLPIPPYRGSPRKTENTQKHEKSQHFAQHVFNHRYPGWFHLSEELEGFDKNACVELTARAEVISLESAAIQSAYQTAQQHILTARQNANFSEEIISLLINNKVREFGEIMIRLKDSETSLKEVWEKYVDVGEHILRRQVLTERRFFSSRYCSNKWTLLLAKEFFKRRVYKYEFDSTNSEEANNESGNNVNLNLTNPLILLNYSPVNYRLPSLRSLITAERSLLETSVLCYQHHDGDVSSNSGHGHGHGHGGGHRSTSPTRASHKDHTGNSGGGGGVVLKTGWTPSHHTTNSNPDSTYHDTTEPSTYPESIMIGASILRYAHKINPRLFPPLTNAKSTPGDDYYHIIDDSAQQLQNSTFALLFLQRIAMTHELEEIANENEGKLAELIFRFSRLGRVIGLTDLLALNEDCVEGDCDTLSRICYHYFVKRLIPFLTSTASSNSPLASSSDSTERKSQNASYESLPLASAQGRCLKMISHGILTFAEVFEEHSRFGIFYFDNQHATEMSTSFPSPPHVKGNKKHEFKADDNLIKGKTRLERLKEQILNVNSLYQKSILEANNINFKPVIQFWKSRLGHGLTIPTYSCCRCELLDCYGGEGDSDQEDGDDHHDHHDGGDHHQGEGKSGKEGYYGSDDKELDYLLSKLRI